MSQARSSRAALAFVAIAALASCARDGGTTTSSPQPALDTRVGYVRMDQLVKKHPLYSQLARLDEDLQALQLKSVGPDIARSGDEIAGEERRLQHELDLAADRTKRALAEKQVAYAKREQAAIDAAMGGGASRGSSGAAIAGGIATQARAQQQSVLRDAQKNLDAYRRAVIEQDRRAVQSLSASLAERASRAFRAKADELQKKESDYALALASDARGIGLLRASDDGAHVALAVVNSDRRATIDIDARTLVAALAGTPRDVTPRLAAKPAVRDGDSIALHPLEIRVFARDAIAQLPDPAAYATHPARAARAVSIEAIDPQIDGGRHAVKCIVGDAVVVEADVFRDGHDEIAVRLLWRAAGSLAWHEAPMQPVGNDRFRGTLTVDTIGRNEYTIEAWPDAFATWRRDVGKKLAAGQDVARELAEGRALLHAAAGRSDATQGDAFTRAIRDIDALESDASRALLLRGDVLAELVASAPDRSAATRYAPALPLDVDRVAGRFSAWYEFFPRSAGAPGVHGTFADAARRLPAIAAMGFDIVYLPPIHPIGRAFRKGPNNSLDAGPDDPGSPWAIGNADGGHTAVEPALGTLSDFDGFVAAARDVGLEVALDYALQCSPDHPFVREHPEWFAFRPDGTIKYAENPPKKYQDIVNFDWYGPAAPALWDALRDIVLFWIAHGVRVFRVDNPHTKPFAFWEWMIADVRGRHPETLFLAEAFTRPKVMAELAKVGFSTSYTYFTWRTTKAELTDYVTELTQTELAQYYRPNFWPNTPDILPPYLQDGGMAAFRIRFVLAATLASAYGIYSGYELGEADALAGREEYADSEKYQLRARDFDVPHSIAPDIARVNAIRRAHPALADWRNVRFYRADDDAVIFFGKRRGNDVIFVAVNLDPHRERDALLWFPTGELGLRDDDDYPVGELLGGTTHAWRGSAHRWRLDPKVNPAAIFHVGVPA
ncbi:MAG: hypothetical protein NVS2B8_13240 [Vulcanimicrobiaceae bacterium]